MKYHRILIILFLWCAGLFAQTMNFYINDPFPSPYLSDWQTDPTIATVTVHNAGNTPQNFYLRIYLNSDNYGDLFRGSSEVFTVMPHSDYTLNTTMLVDFNNVQINNAIKDQVINTNLIPEGNYTADVELVYEGDDEPIDLQTQYFYIVSFNLPELVIPYDTEVLQILNQPFQWLPVVDGIPGFNVHYRLFIYEIEPGQMPWQVIQSSYPFFETEVINQTEYIYSAAAPPFERGQKYIWYVQAENDFGEPLGENEGRSQIWSFYYQEQVEITQDLADLERLELVPYVAYLKGLDQITASENDEAYILDGSAVLTVFLPSAGGLAPDSLEIGVMVSNLSFLKGSLFPPVFTGGEVFADISADFPAIAALEQFPIQPQNISFDPAQGLTLGARFAIPLNPLINPVELSGRMTLSSAGFAGELSYEGDYEHSLVSLDHELLSLRLTSVNINLESGQSDMDLQVKLLNQENILNFPNLSFSNLELSLPLNLSEEYIIPLVPDSRLAELIIGRVSGLASINLTSGDFDFDLLVNAALKLPYVGSPGRYPEMSLRINKQSGLSVENMNLNLDQSLQLGFDYLQMGLSDLQIPELSFVNNQFDFQITFNADLDLPSLENVNFPLIRDVSITRNGISIGEQVFANLDLPPLEFAGFRLAVNRFVVSETSFNWFSGEIPDWGFSVDADMTFPNFPVEYGEILRQTIIPLNGVNIGSARWQTALPQISFHENQAEIPLGGGAAFYVDALSGMLDINLTGGNLISNSRLDMQGRLQMPDFFSCPEAEAVNTALQLNGFGHISGTVENFVPSCPLELGFLSLTVNSSNLEFSYANDAQSALLSGSVTARLPGVGGGETTASGTIAIDLISGELQQADIVVEDFVLNLPAEDPVFSFNINLARITKTGIFIHGTNQLNLGNSTVGVVFDSLVLNPVAMRVVSGRAFFNSSFAFKVAIQDGALDWLAVSTGTVLEDANALLMNLPDNISFSAAGISFSGSALMDLNYAGQSLGALNINFSENFALQFSPFGVSGGQADIFYEANRIAYIDGGGIHFDLTMFGEQALPERLPLPDIAIAYLQVKEGGNSLLNVEVDNSGVRLSTTPGNPVKLVMPALQFGEAAPPELGVEFSIVVDPIGLQLRDGRINAVVPEDIPGFDLSKLGIPINIKNIIYQDVSGIKTFALKGLPAFMGTVFPQADSLLMAVEENGRLVANLNLELQTDIPLLEGSEMVLFNIKTIQGQIDCSVNNLQFNLQAASAIKMEMDGAPQDVAVFNMGVSQDGFSITDVDMAPGVDDLSLDLGVVGLKLSNFTIPVLSYNRNNGWDFAFDFNVNMRFPQLGDFELPQMEHFNLTRTGLTIPQTSIPDLDIAPFELGGFSLKPLAFRIPGVEINIFEGNFDFGALSDFKFDFELNMPNLAAELPPELANIGLTVSDCGYVNGILIGTVQPRNVSEPGIPIPLGNSAQFYANLFRGSLYNDNGNQRFSLEIGGAFQLPAGLFPGTEPTEIATTLQINSTGQIAGTVSGFIPNRPLVFGPVNLTVSTANLMFEVNAGNQSAILDMAAQLRLPAPQEGDSVTASGNIALDLINGDFINGQIAINSPFSFKLPADGNLLNFTINSAILNPQGLSISGSNSLNLGQNSVSCSFTNFTVGLNPFRIRSGAVTFASSFAFKLGIEAGELNWQSVLPNPELTEDFAIALNLPDQIGISDGGFTADGAATVNLRFNGEEYNALNANFTNNFALQFQPVKVKTGRVEFIRDNEVLAYLDSTGFIPGNILGAMPIPDSIPLPSMDIAYMLLRENGELMVETTCEGEACQLQVKEGHSVKIFLPALAHEGDIPQLQIEQFSIGVNKTTYQLVNGTLQVSASEGETLLNLAQRGIPLDLTRFGCEKISGEYRVILGANIQMPGALSDINLSVDSLSLSASGISGAVSAGEYHQYYTPEATYLEDLDLGGESGVHVKVEGVQAEFNPGDFQIRFSGDLTAALFAEEDTPANLHYCADVGTDSVNFDVDISHLENGIPMKIARLKALADMGGELPISFSAAGNDFVVGINARMEIPSFGEEFAVEVRGMRISKNNGIQLPELNVNPDLQFKMFAMGFDINELGFFYESQVFGLSVGGQITIEFLNNNTTDFSGLQIGSNGSVHIEEASLISQPIPVVENILRLKQLGFHEDSLQVMLGVTPPEPLGHNESDVNFYVAPNGSVGGGGNVVLINEESVIDEDDTEWSFWKGTLDVVYLGLVLDFNDISTSTVQLNSDLWVKNSKIQLGYKEGGTVMPGLQIGFNGDVDFANYRLVGDLSFDLEVLQFGLTQITPVEGSEFGVALSGNLGMTIQSVTSDITFNNLEINRSGGMPNIASSISGGQFTIGEVFSLEMLTFEYKAPRDDGTQYELAYNLGGIPPEGESGSSDAQNIMVDSYLQFGINVTVADVFSGGVDRFLLFYQEGRPNLIMNNLNVSIEDVFTASMDLAYLNYDDGFSFLVAGEADVKNTMHFAVVGAFEKRSGNLRFGMFAMAELPGMGIVLYPGIFLAEVGGGFFYNPREEWLTMVVSKTPLGGHPITAELPTGEHYGGGDPSFAILLYAGITIVDGSMVSGRVMLTITDNYINLAGLVTLLDRENELVGGFRLAASLRQLYIEGIFFVEVKMKVVEGEGTLQFLISNDIWFIKGNVHAVIINEDFLEVTSKFFVGNPGFMFMASSHSTFGFWIIDVNTDITGMVWIRWEGSREVGAYFEFQVSAEVLWGVITGRFWVKAMLLIEPGRFVLYGAAGGEVCVLWGAKCWDGSFWVRISNKSPKFKGDFGSDPEMDAKIEDAENMGEEMEDAVAEAEAAMEANIMEPFVLSEDELRQAGANLFAANVNNWTYTWWVVETANGGFALNNLPTPLYDQIMGTNLYMGGNGIPFIQINEQSMLNNYRLNFLNLSPTVLNRLNAMFSLVSQQNNLLDDIEDISGTLQSNLAATFDQLPPIDNNSPAYEIFDPVTSSSDSVAYVVTVNADGDSVLTFTELPGLETDSGIEQQNADRAAEMTTYSEQKKEQVYQRILAMNSNLQNIDVALNGSESGVSLNALGRKYMDAQEKLEEFYLNNAEFIYEIAEMAAPRMDPATRFAYTRNARLVMSSKSHRIEDRASLRAMARQRAVLVLYLVHMGNSEAYQNSLDSIYQVIEGFYNDNDISHLKSSCFLLGEQLWADIPVSGMRQMVQQVDTAITGLFTRRQAEKTALDEQHSSVSRLIDSLYQKRAQYAQKLYELCERYVYWEVGPHSAEEMNVVDLQTGASVSLADYINNNVLLNNGEFQYQPGLIPMGGMQILGGNLPDGGDEEDEFSQVLGSGQFTQPVEPVTVAVSENWTPVVHTDIMALKQNLAIQLTPPQIENITVNTFKNRHTAYMNAFYSASHPAGIANYSYTIEMNSGNANIYSDQYKFIGDRNSLSSYYIPPLINPNIPDLGRRTSQDYTLKIKARSLGGQSNRRIANFQLSFDGSVNGEAGDAYDMMGDYTPPVLNDVRLRPFQFYTTFINNIVIDAYDPQSDIAQYEVALGAQPGMDEATLQWATAVGIDRFTISDINLQHNQDYYIYARVKNSVNMSSPVVMSNPVLVDTSRPGPVSIDQASNFSLNTGSTSVYETASSEVFDIDGNPFIYSTPLMSLGGADSQPGMEQLISPLGGNLMLIGDLGFQPSLNITFNEAGDPESGIAQYAFKIMGGEEGDEPLTDWLLLGLDENDQPLQAINIVGEPLQYGQSYYIKIVAINRAGLVSPEVTTSQLIPTDPTAPAIPGLFYGENSPEGQPYHISNLNELLFGLTPSSDPESGIQGYEYKIGTTSGGNDVCDWTSDSLSTFNSSEDFNPQVIPGNLFTMTQLGGGIIGYIGGGDVEPADGEDATDVINLAGGTIILPQTAPNRLKITGLQLTSGQNYYLSLRAVNNAGSTSAAVVSKVIRPDISIPGGFHVFPPYYSAASDQIVVGVVHLSDVESGIRMIKIDRDGGTPNSVTADHKLEIWPFASPGYMTVYTYRFGGFFISGRTYGIKVIVQNRAGLNSTVRSFSVPIP